MFPLLDTRDSTNARILMNRIMLAFKHLTSILMGDQVLIDLKYCFSRKM